MDQLINTGWNKPVSSGTWKRLVPVSCKSKGACDENLEEILKLLHVNVGNNIQNWSQPQSPLFPLLFLYPPLGKTASQGSALLTPVTSLQWTCSPTSGIDRVHDRTVGLDTSSQTYPNWLSPPPLVFFYKNFHMILCIYMIAPSHAY